MAISTLLSGRRDGDTLQLTASGDWTGLHASELEEQLRRCLKRTNGLSHASIALDDISGFDTFGAWLLERLRRDLASKGLQVSTHGLSDDMAPLLEDIAATNKRQTPLPSPPRFNLGLDAMGRAIAGLGTDLRHFLNLFGALTFAAGAALRHPARFRLTSSVHQLDRAGWRAVPIVLLITFLIGAIIAQQGFFHFSKFGADAYVVDMVGILVLRELGVLLVAIMIAGRSGSAYTAELGSMKMREEIDALKTMGFNPVEILILPRVVVLTLAVPLLTFLGMLAALYGGGLVAWAYGGMAPDIYITRLREAISMTHFEVGMIKAPFMGMMIAIVSCMEGLQVRGSAESLGHHTTQSVVKSIFLVIVLDGLFAIFFAAIGM